MAEENPSSPEVEPVSSNPNAIAIAIPDDPDAIAAPSLPLSASIILTSLPRDAHTALSIATANTLSPAQPPQKITVRFKAVGSAPILQKQVYKINAAQRFETVVKFLRTRLRCKEGEAVFCYVNSVFAPGLDEGVGGLFNVRGCPVL